MTFTKKFMIRTTGTAGGFQDAGITSHRGNSCNAALRKLTTEVFVCLFVFYGSQESKYNPSDQWDGNTMS